MRLFAILLAVLALGAQQRVVNTVRLVPVTATRAVAERSKAETIESNAVRAVSVARVARAPLLTRLPVAPAPVGSSRSPGVRLLISRAAFVQRAQLVTHFHAKRRIPRMNSEEPPRG